MKNKIITTIASAAILFSMVCTGIIITQGIQHGGTSGYSHAAEKRQAPRAWELEKTRLDAFSDISISLSYCDLGIYPADDYYLEYRMDGTCEEPEYNSAGNRFYFQEGAVQPRYRIGFPFFFHPRFSSANKGPFYVNLYIPKEQYLGLLQLSSESGNVELGDIQAKDIDIRAEYGNLTCGGISADDISIAMESGNIDVISATCDTLDITNEYGDIRADSFHAASQASIKLESGSLTLSKLETDSLILSNDYGNCSIDKTNVKQSDVSIESGNLKLQDATLGTTEIKNEYGDITIKLADESSEYNYDLNAEYGSIKLNGKTLPADEDGISRYQKDNGKESEIIIGSESGNIVIH